MNRRAQLAIAGALILAVLAALLSFHRSYSPGPLLEGHQPFNSNCAACHQPWTGVELASTGCVDCHGKLPDSNPHSAIKVSDNTSGVIRGKQIARFHDNLACRSCHSDHIGRSPDLAKISGGNCAWCHQHPSISQVSPHSKDPMLLEGAAFHVFERVFSHQKHLKITIDHLKNPPQPERLTEAEAAALTLLLDSKGQHFECRTCHQVVPASPGQPEQFSFSMAGCAISNCHPSWHDPRIRLTREDPDYELQQTANSPDPQQIRYVAASRFQFVKAIFAHSRGHLRSNCVECHVQMEQSAKPGDYRSKRIANCFGCHAHQPGESAVHVASAIGIFAASSASAASTASPSAMERKVVGCAECHAFHNNYKGGKVVKDFQPKAPTIRPHEPAGLQFTAYTISVHRNLNGSPNVALEKITVRPWWIVLLAFLTMSLIGVAYLNYLPTETPRSPFSAGPQRTPEIPALDDNYQSSVPRVYIVGEAGGTASINLAMRSGREVIGLIANALRIAKRPVEPEVYDIAIIGCGPAGISAGGTAKKNGLNYLALEKTTAASTIRMYPRGKFVQATPIELDEYGWFSMEGDNTKEELVKKWEEMLLKMQLQINEREEVTSVSRAGDSFEIATLPGRRFKARYVMLAIGVRGTPRKLGVAGETADRVFYNLVEPEEFKDKRILVVGGGNAGAEVTQMLANPALRNVVAYSFRDAALGPPVTPENAGKISDLQQSAHITLYPWSQVKELKPGKVVLAPRSGASPKQAQPTDQTTKQHSSRGVFARLLSLFTRRKPDERASESTPTVSQAPDHSLVKLTEPLEIENDFVFAMLGADLPTPFMKSIGIRMTRKGF